MAIAINPDLDWQALAEAYREKRRGQVKTLLTDAAAQEVHRALQELPWGLVYNEGSEVVQLSPDRVAQLREPEASAIMAGIRERARSEYQYFYSYFPILTAYFSPQSPRFGIFDFYEFLNSEPVLERIRAMTGLDQIRWADGQATWYKPGHFLKAHTDQHSGEGRLAAYVMNLSPVWERDWGGFLQFFDADENIEMAFKPAFNTLNLFTIPQLHSVSMVSTYVTAQRLAVTGWFRSDEPLGPTGNRG